MTTTQRVIYHCILLNEEYTPFTEKINSALFKLLKSKLYMTPLWKKAMELDKSCFEAVLHNDETLQDAYVELYNKSAEYYFLDFRFGDEQFELYFMYNNGIVLIFYRQEN